MTDSIWGAAHVHLNTRVPLEVGPRARRAVPEQAACPYLTAGDVDRKGRHIRPSRRTALRRWSQIAAAIVEGCLEFAVSTRIHCRVAVSPSITQYFFAENSLELCDWKKEGLLVATATLQGRWLGRVYKAVWETIKAPQWLMLLVVVFLGLVSNSEADFLMVLIGLMVALVLFLWAAVALGYDGGNPLAFFLKFEATPWRQSIVAFCLLVLAGGVVWTTSRVEGFADWLISKLPSTLTPNPDQSLSVVFVACVASTALSIIALLVRKRSLHFAEQDPIAWMNRRARRANGVTKKDVEEFNARRLAALNRRDYWIEASMVLGLAAVAVLPGALGWTWLWGVALSIVLPMFVLSVRFRTREN